MARLLLVVAGFWLGMLHAAYGGADFVKAILVALAAWTVARRP